MHIEICGCRMFGRNFASRKLSNRVMILRTGTKLTGECWTASDVVNFKVRVASNLPSKARRALDTFMQKHVGLFAVSTISPGAAFAAHSPSAIPSGAQLPVPAPTPPQVSKRPAGTFRGSAALDKIAKRPAAHMMHGQSAKTRRTR